MGLSLRAQGSGTSCIELFSNGRVCFETVQGISKAVVTNASYHPELRAVVILSLRHLIVVLLGEKNHRCSPDFALLFTVPIFLPILGQHVQFRVPVHLLFILRHLVWLCKPHLYSTGEFLVQGFRGTSFSQRCFLIYPR